MKTKLLFLLIAISAVFYSCSDKPVDLVDENEPKSFTEYLEFLLTPTDGSIIIQRVGSLYDAADFSISSSISGDRMPFSLDINGEKVSFKEYYYSKTKGFSYSHENHPDLSLAYGNFFNIEVLQTGAENVVKAMQTKNSDTGGVYIPELIDVAFSGLSNGKITAGSTITWNADQNNSNGLIIGFEYQPLMQADQDIAQMYPEYILKGMTVSESGSYTVKQEDLGQLPNNAAILFSIARVGVGIVTFDNNQTFSVAGYSLIESYQQVKR